MGAPVAFEIVRENWFEFLGKLLTLGGLLSSFDVEQPLHASVTNASELVAGGHSVAWDGTDENGVRLSSGIYIYRLVTSSTTLSQKMVLMK